MIITEQVVAASTSPQNDMSSDATLVSLDMARKHLARHHVPSTCLARHLLGLSRPKEAKPTQRSTLSPRRHGEFGGYANCSAQFRRCHPKRSRARLSTQANTIADSEHQVPTAMLEQVDVSSHRARPGSAQIGRHIVKC